MKNDDEELTNGFLGGPGVPNSGLANTSHDFSFSLESESVAFLYKGETLYFLSFEKDALSPLSI